MEHTEYHQLCLWDPEDRILREDFNSDNAKTEAALADLTEAVAGCGNCKIVYGSYTGTGNYSSAHPNTLDFSGEPRFIVVCDNRIGGLLFMFRPGTIGLGFTGLSAVPGPVNPEWDPKSVSWYSSESANQQFNASGRTYSYAGFYGSED